MSEEIEFVGKTLALAIATWGEEMQSVVAIEELSELIKEIVKAYRGKLNKANMVEEMADVEIMMLQLKAMYNIRHEDIHAAKMKKIKRLAITLKRIINE